MQSYILTYQGLVKGTTDSSGLSAERVFNFASAWECLGGVGVEVRFCLVPFCPFLSSLLMDVSVCYFIWLVDCY